jgi:asparagine N-glycosylation enzyme membrane subunit Stt3
LVVVLAVLAIVAGVFILLKLFGLVFPMSNLILIILATAWLVFIIMIDIIHPLKNKPEFVNWLRDFGAHLMVLGGILLATDRFGRK